MRLIDTHSHLNFPQFQDDWNQVLKSCQKKKIGVIVVSSDLETSQRAIKIANSQLGFVWGAVGIHPINLDQIKTNNLNSQFKQKRALDQITHCLGNKKVVAIGETGLDYAQVSRNEEKKFQQEFFKKFISIAVKTKKPLILHCRAAEDDFLKILEYQTILPKGVVHCFPGHWLMAQKILSKGFNISFTGLITYNLSSKTKEVIEKTPLERILIETDSPFMVPAPFRDKIKRNEPIFVQEVAKKIAQIKRISFKEVAKTTTNNAKKLFKLMV